MHCNLAKTKIKMKWYYLYFTIDGKKLWLTDTNGFSANQEHENAKKFESQDVEKLKRLCHGSLKAAYSNHAPFLKNTPWKGVAFQSVTINHEEIEPKEIGIVPFPNEENTRVAS